MSGLPTLRKIVYRFVELPHHCKMTVALDCGVYDAVDTSANTDKDIFKRVKAADKLAELWRAIYAEHIRIDPSRRADLDACVTGPAPPPPPDPLAGIGNPAALRELIRVVRQYLDLYDHERMEEEAQLALAPLDIAVAALDLVEGYGGTGG